jgi:hypothetical protein
MRLGNHLKHVVLTALLACCTLGAPAARAILDEVSWEATRVVRVDGREIKTRVHHAKLKERISAVVKGVELDLVLRYDRKLLWQMTSLFELAAETDISAMDTPANIRVLSRTRVGNEPVGGAPATHWRLSYQTQGGAKHEGEYWQNAAGVHVKSRFSVSDPEGKSRQVELELRDLQVGPQSADLFEVPEGYKVMPLDSGELIRSVLGF